jgi:hypothetical protein
MIWGWSALGPTPTPLHSAWRRWARGTRPASESSPTQDPRHRHLQAPHQRLRQQPHYPLHHVPPTAAPQAALVATTPDPPAPLLSGVGATPLLSLVSCPCLRGGLAVAGHLWPTHHAGRHLLCHHCLPPISLCPGVNAGGWGSPRRRTPYRCRHPFSRSNTPQAGVVARSVLLSSLSLVRLLLVRPSKVLPSLSAVLPSTGCSTFLGRLWAHSSPLTFPA